jgi:hypothetical protein
VARSIIHGPTSKVSLSQLLLIPQLFLALLVAMLLVGLLSVPGSPGASTRQRATGPRVGAGAGAGASGNVLGTQDAQLTAAELPHSYGGRGVLEFGDATFHGAPTNMYLGSLVVSMAATPDGGGYWLVASDGGVFAYGDAHYYGSTGNIKLYAPVVGIATTPDGKGYWLAAADGGVFAFGDAKFRGSMGGKHLNAPVVGISSTPNGKGYWLVASDGGVFAFGNAKFHGSMGGRHINAPVVAIAASANGAGYWMAGSDGGVYAFGNAPFYGSMGSHPPYNSIRGFATRPDNGGYWMVDWGGQVYGFGHKPLGSIGGSVPAIPVTDIVSTSTGDGYWLLAPEDFAYTFTNSPIAAPSPVASAIVSVATSQVGGDPDLSEGPFCNPYGPCEQWCSYFATWTWESAGVGIPNYGFVGDVYDWGASLGLDLPAGAVPKPGDAILYGTGPDNTNTSVHVGVVAEVWPDGEVVTVEGDAGPGLTGQLNVVVNGPFMPADSAGYNGFPVYAYVDPP